MSSYKITLREVLIMAMSLLTGRTLDVKDLAKSSLNIICSRYFQGQEIPKHADRVGDFGFSEDAFGCILENSSDQVLEFEGPDSLYKLEEFPGVCIHQTGDARYKWKHGAPLLSKGTRDSVSWRWFSQGSEPAPTFQIDQGDNNRGEPTLREAPSVRPSQSVIIPETSSYRKPQANIPAEELSAQAFTASIYDLVGRPFKSKKHLAPPV